MKKKGVGNRKSRRLHGRDYKKSGRYFITICSYHHQSIFGNIKKGLMLPSTIGEIVYSEWFKIPGHRNNIVLYEDEFILMPNHIHAILWIDGMVDELTPGKEQPHNLKSGSLGAIIGQFKSRTSRMVNEIRNTPGSTIWQRNYYDHIIRNEKDLAQIRKYILDNPLKWAEEKGMNFPS